MKKNYLKITLELIGLQLFFSVLSLIFSAFFSWMDNWAFVFSLLTGWLFLGAVHSTFWQMGNKDYKNNVIANNHLEEGQEPKKLNFLNGLKAGSVFFVINVLIVLATMIFDSGNDGNGGVLFIIHRIMLGALFGFIPNNEWYWPVCYLLCIVMYMPCITAYISGAHSFSLTEKIVPKLLYKTDKKD